MLYIGSVEKKQKQNSSEPLLPDYLVLPKDVENEINNAEKPFSEYLRALMLKKNMDASEVWKRGGLEKKYYSKLMNDEYKMPSKLKILMVAIGLCLDIQETTELLTFKGYTLSGNDKKDLIFKYYIEKQEYDIYAISKEIHTRTGENIMGEE